jgi:hypothetical protein
MPAEINTGEAEPSELDGGDELFSAIDALTGGTDEGQQDAGELPIQGADAGGDGQQQAPSKEASPTKKDTPPAKKDEQGAKTEEGKNGEYPAEIKSTKAREHFDALKAKEKEASQKAAAAESRAKALESEVKQLKENAGTSSPEFKALEKEVATLRKQLEEKDGIISYKAVEETTGFRENVIKPKKEANTEIDQLIEQYKLDGALIDRAIGEPNKFRRLDLLEQAANLDDIPEAKRALIVQELKSNVEKWLKADQEEQTLRSNAKGNREAVEAQQREEEAKKNIARARDFEKATTEVEQILRKNTPELFEPDGEVEEKLWKEIQANAAKIKDLDKLPARAKVFNNFAANAYQPLVNLNRSLKAKVAELEKTIAERESGLPGAGAGRVPAKRGTGSGGNEEGDEEENLVEFMDRM